MSGKKTEKYTEACINWKRWIIGGQVIHKADDLGNVMKLRIEKMELACSNNNNTFNSI